MGRHSWYRNEDWSTEIETAFREKLARARQKAPPLRIQAWYLRDARPEIALKLLDEFFGLDETPFDLAQGHVQAAQAWLKLGDRDKAIASFEAAVAREDEYPTLQTEAWSMFARLVIGEELTEYYGRLLNVLKVRTDWLTFPIDRFRWNAAMAVIAKDIALDRTAAEYASDALAAARAETSGIARREGQGLVRDKEPELRAIVEKLAEG